MKTYKKYLNSKQLQASTIKNYLWHVKQFLKWLDKRPINKNELKKYFDYLLKKYQKINTINLRLKIINNYLKFLNKKIQLDLLSAENLPIRVLSNDQLNIFLESPQKKDDILYYRDKALLELLYFSGLKVGQIVGLKISQVDQLRQEIFLDKNQSIKISPSVWSWLKKYLGMRHDNIDYIFINFDRSNKSTDKSLSVRSIERIIEKYAKKIYPPVSINPQILRNTLAYNLKIEGAQSEHIKKALNFKTKAGAKNYLKKI